MKTKTKLPTILGSLALLLALAACHALDHRVGTGAAGNAATSQRQWYVLWGLVPIGTKVDSHAMAGGAANYDVHSEQNVVDVIINIFAGIVSIHAQTVTVKK